MKKIPIRKYESRRGWQSTGEGEWKRDVEGDNVVLCVSIEVFDTSVFVVFTLIAIQEDQTSNKSQ